MKVVHAKQITTQSNLIQVASEIIQEACEKAEEICPNSEGWLIKDSILSSDRSSFYLNLEGIHDSLLNVKPPLEINTSITVDIPISKMKELFMLSGEWEFRSLHLSENQFIASVSKSKELI